MEIFYCVTCGKRLTDKDVAAGHARDKKLKGIFCKTCAVGVTTTDEMPLSEEQAREILRKEKEGLGGVSASGPTTPRYYFCEKCGKRLDDEDFETGRARDKKLNGVYCVGCSDGVWTEEFEGLTDEEARRLVARSKPPSRKKLIPPRRRGAASSSTTLVRAARRPKSGVRRGADEEEYVPPVSRLPLWIGLISAALGALGVFAVVSGIGTGRPGKSRKVAKTKVPAKKTVAKNSRSETDTAGKRSHSEAIDSGTGVSSAAPNSGPRARRRKARAAFHELKSKLEPRTPDEKREAIRLCEAFLAQYGNSEHAKWTRTKLRILKLDKKAAGVDPSEGKWDPNSLEPTPPTETGSQTASAGHTSGTGAKPGEERPLSHVYPLVDESKLLPGLVLTLFNNSDLSPNDRMETRLLRTFDFLVKKPDDSFASYAAVGKSNWSMQYTGLLKVPKNAEYGFKQASREFSRVAFWIGDRKVFDGTKRAYQKTVRLKKGLHRIRLAVCYGDMPRKGNMLDLFKFQFWTSNGIARRPGFPVSAVFFDPKDPNAAKALAVPKGKRVYLSDLKAFGHNLSPTTFGTQRDGEIKVAGKVSPNGLWMAPPAEGKHEALFFLGGAFSSFTGWVALNDSSPKLKKGITFSVYGDGKRKWLSQPISQTGGFHKFDVDIKGVSLLKLSVRCGPGNKDADPVWSEPQVSR